MLHALDARHVLTSVYATSQQLVWVEGSGLALDQAISWRVQAGVEALAAGLNALGSGRIGDSYVVQAEPVRLAS